MKECKCKDWKENIPILSSALVLQDGHFGGSGLKKNFDYCPYCGKRLLNTQTKSGRLKLGGAKNENSIK
jgi:hypothetical protein